MFLQIIRSSQYSFHTFIIAGLSSLSALCILHTVVSTRVVYWWYLTHKLTLTEYYVLLELIWQFSRFVNHKKITNSHLYTFFDFIPIKHDSSLLHFIANAFVFSLYMYQYWFSEYMWLYNTSSHSLQQYFTVMQIKFIELHRHHFKPVLINLLVDS